MVEFDPFVDRVGVTWQRNQLVAAASQFVDSRQVVTVRTYMCFHQVIGGFCRVTWVR